MGTMGSGNLETGITERKTAKRKDAGQFHSVARGLLSRHPLTALRRLGENPKVLRRLERRLREALKPQGAVAELLFDRLWSAHLYSILAGRITDLIVERLTEPTDRSVQPPALFEGETRSLVGPEVNSHCPPNEIVLASVVRDLCLIERYRARSGKEEFRTLALLLVSLNGEAALPQAIVQLLGIDIEVLEDSKHGS